MWGRYAVILIIGLWTGSTAVGEIYEWGGAGGGYEIHQASKTVKITAAGTYKFHSLTGEGSLDNINHIYTDTGGVTGTVNIYIQRDPDDLSGNKGAVDLGQMNLSTATTGNLVKLYITGDVAATGDVIVDNITEAFVVDGDVVNDIDVDDDVSCTMTIGGLLYGDLDCDSAEDININGTHVSYNNTGEIHIWGDYGDSLHIADDCEELIQINGDLEFTGDIETDGDVDSIYIDGNLAGTIDVGNDLTGMLIYGYWNGSVYVRDDVLGTLDATGANSGKLNVYGDVRATALINVDSTYGLGTTIFGDLEGDISGGLGITELIRVHGDVDGSIKAWGNLTDEIEIREDLSYGATIEVTGDITSAGSIDIWDYQYGDIEVDDDVAGTIEVGEDLHQGTIVIDGDLDGSIDITGDLYDYAGNTSGGHIIVNGSLGSSGEINVDGEFYDDTEFITIDYDGDGWDTGDSWESGGEVSVDGTTYTSAPNTLATRVWEVTPCKGDMNNDGDINGYDVDPYTTALGSLDDYAEDWPGLGGSVIMHGDCDCDDDIDGFDTDDFVEIIGSGECGDQCDGGDGGGGFGGTAKEMAEMLMDTVSDANMDALIALIEDLIDSLGDSPEADFWQDVLDYLEA